MIKQILEQANQTNKNKSTQQHNKMQNDIQTKQNIQYLNLEMYTYSN